MKNLKKYTKVIAVSTLATAITISMSFKPQKAVETHAQEMSSFNSFHNVEANDTKGAKKYLNRINAVANVAGFAASVYTMFQGGGKVSQNNLMSAKTKVSQFD